MENKDIQKDPWAGEEKIEKAAQPIVYITEPAKEAKMAELDSSEIQALAAAAMSTPLPAEVNLQNAGEALPRIETLLAAAKVLSERARSEWKAAAQAAGENKVDYAANGLRLQIISSKPVPVTSEEALIGLRDTNPAMYAKIAKPGIKAPASKVASLEAKVDKLQGELLKAQAELETYENFNHPSLIEDAAAVKEAAGDWDGIEWQEKKAPYIKAAPIPAKKPAKK